MIEVVIGGTVMIVVSVISCHPVETVVFPFCVIVVTLGHATSRDVVIGGKEMVVGLSSVRGGRMRLHGASHVARGLELDQITGSI